MVLISWGVTLVLNAQTTGAIYITQGEVAFMNTLSTLMRRFVRASFTRTACVIRLI